MKDDLELNLPTAKNEHAEFVIAEIKRILPILPSGVDVQAFAAAVVIAANELDPGKVNGSASVLIAACNAARVGLPPGSFLGLCYFIPRKGRCNLEFGYRGYMDLAFSNEFLGKCSTDVILMDEHFEQWHDEKGRHILHKPLLERDPSRKTVLGAYCSYTTRAGFSDVELVNRKQLDRVDTNAHVWKSDYVSMCRKTPVRRAAKYWKITTRMALAMHLDDQAERGEVQDIGVLPQFEDQKTLSLDELE